MGSGEVFSIDEPTTKDKDPILENINEEEDEWQDVEVSEEWGPQTPMTPLNDDTDDMLQMRPAPRQHIIDHRYPVSLFLEPTELQIFVITLQIVSIL